MKRSTAGSMALASSVLMSLAFPPFGLGFLAYVGLIPLILLTEKLTIRQLFFWSWISGVAFYAVTISWILNVTWIGMILAVLVMAIFYALPFVITGFVRTVHPRLWLLSLPFVLAGLEWIRSFDQLAFPWMIVGNSQTYYPWLIQFADITSAFGVSWWVAMVNTAIVLLARRRSVARFAFLGLLFLVPLFYSQAVIRSANDSGRKITVALVQGNVLPDEKWDENMVLWNVNLYRTMSQQAMAYKPDLLVWPETAIPTYLLEAPVYRWMVQALVDSTGVPLLTGLPAVDLTNQDTFNAAGLFLPNENKVRRYDKIHMVPFGEAIPLDEYFPALRKLDWGQANWRRGKEAVIFTSKQLPPFNAAICFESIFPDLIRKFIVKGSQFITVITNDVWFGPRFSPIQHAMISVMRAIEFHRPVVRCANTGISMIIDPYGRVMKKTKTFERTTLIGTITPQTGMTFYARYGNLFSLGCFLFSLILLFFTVYKKRHNSTRVL
ncbi:MAG: apolipoprotein N-acyltransferase [Candidatus Latescibacter sp.]|nr:apolipoprotein N-acyltransferase [Candidatus Latescibacter sp.]